MVPTVATTIPDGPNLVFIGEVAPELGVSPAALFQSGCRREITLYRIGGRWACDRAEAEAWAGEVSIPQPATRTAPANAAE